MICGKCGYLNSDDQIRCVQCSTSLDRFESPTLDYRLSTDRVTVGEVFAGRYRILRMLKSGGMSFVYEAFDEKVQQKVALKILKPGLTEDTTTIRRFQGEVRLARRIGHQNVCRIYDLEESNGILFISMELIEGLNLKERIQKMGPMTEKEGIPICIQILDGLQSAHSSGIIHRDLKPQNIMIDPKGNPRILDFGLSRALDAEGVTLFGAVMGTPGYMAPEQGLGETAEERSDIYSMGAIMYELFTGTLPFQAETPAKLIYKHVYTVPTDPKKRNPSISSNLAKVILRCLEKKKEKRYRNVAELIQALTLLEEGKPLPANLVTPSRFHPALLVLALVLLAVIGTAGYLTYSYFKKPEKRVAITILPIRNQTGSTDLNPLMLPLTELMISSLFASDQVKVLPYDRLYEAEKILNQSGYQGTDRNAVKLLGELNGSSYVIEPTLFLVGNTLQAKIEWRDPRTAEVLKMKMLEYKFSRDPRERMNEFIQDTSNQIQKEITGKEGHYVPLTTDMEVLLPYNRATNAFLQGNYPGAIQDYQHALEKDSRFPDALLGLADSYHRLGYDGEAAKYAKDAVLAAAQRSMPSARKSRIEAKYAEINYDFTRAESLYRELTETIPDDPTLYVALGNSLEKLARNQEAHASFRKAIQLSPYYAEAYIEDAKLMSAEGSYDGAMDNFKRALFEFERLQNTDQQAKVLIQQASVLRVKGDFPQAEEVLKQAEPLVKQSNNPITRANFLKHQADVNLNRHLTDQAMQQYEEALQIFQKANDEKMIGSIQINIGSVHILRGEFSEAEKYLRSGEAIGKRIQSYRLQAEANFNLASVFRKQGKYPEAMNHVNQAEALDKLTGDQTGVILDAGMKGDILIYTGQYEHAFQAYSNQLLSAEKLGNVENQAQALAGLGEYYFLVERFGQAEEDFRKAMEIYQQIKYPSSEYYCSQYLARTLTRLGRFQDADPIYINAEKIAKEYDEYDLPPVLNARGWNELQKGNWVEAGRFLESAARLSRELKDQETLSLAEFNTMVLQLLSIKTINIAGMEMLYRSLPGHELELSPLMALAYERNNQLQKALDVLQSQTSAAADKPVTRCLMFQQIARLQRKLGNETEASRFAQQAKELSNQLKFQTNGKVTEALLET